MSVLERDERIQRCRNSLKDFAEESGGRRRQTAGKTGVFVQETRTTPVRLAFLLVGDWILHRALSLCSPRGTASPSKRKTCRNRLWCILARNHGATDRPDKPRADEGTGEIKTAERQEVGRIKAPRIVLLGDEGRFLLVEYQNERLVSGSWWARQKLCLDFES